MSDARPRNFLGLDPADCDPRRSAVLVLPVPYEATASFGGGTRRGPQAIVDASGTVELYDHEHGDEPYRIGVATLDPVPLTSAGPEAGPSASAMLARKDKLRTTIVYNALNGSFT